MRVRWGWVLLLVAVVSLPLYAVVGESWMWGGLAGVCFGWAGSRWVGGPS